MASGYPREGASSRLGAFLLHECNPCAERSSVRDVVVGIAIAAVALVRMLAPYRSAAIARSTSPWEAG